MAIPLSPLEKDIRRIVASVIELVKGRNNAVGTVTLATGATKTTVKAVNCGAKSAVFLFASTAAAAAEVTTTYIAAADIKRGSFAITHLNNAIANRTFGWLALG